MRYGDIYFASFLVSVGHEYKGERPVIIIQSDEQIKKSNLITIMPLTSKLNNSCNSDILIRKNNTNKLFCDSIIKTQHINSFDKSRFTKIIGKADNETLQKVKNYLKAHFNMDF